VICLTCQSQHNYRQPPGEKKPGTAKVMRVSREMKKTTTPAGGARVFAQWVKNKEDLGETEPRLYNFQAAFEAGEPLSHPKFGLGFVQKVIPPNKIEVMFEMEIKTLAINS
jgi:hypothetical protein